MKKAFICLLLFIIASIPAYCGPHILCDNNEKDFGDLFAGQKAEYDFEIKNTGDKTLEISKVNLSCPSCTQTKLESDTVLPDKATKLSVSFIASNPGANLQRSISLYSNDPDTPILVLKVKCTVIKVAELSPRKVFFGNLQTGSRCERVVSLIPIKPVTFKIISLKCTIPELKATYKCIDKNNYEVKIVVNAPKTEGRVFGKVVIKTEIPQKTNIDMLVYGNIVKSDK